MSSLRVSPEDLLLTTAINASEKCFVATCVITGDFLNADMDKFALLVLYAQMIGVIIEANKKYEAFIPHKLIDRKRVMYVELVKVMYECLKITHLFWEIREIVQIFCISNL